MSFCRWGCVEVNCELFEGQGGVGEVAVSIEILSIPISNSMSVKSIVSGGQTS